MAAAIYTSEISQWENVSSPGCHFCHVVCWTCQQEGKGMQLSIQIGTCLKSCLHGSISKHLLEMILNCYRSCRYRLNLLGVCMLHKTTTKQVKELAENQKLKWKVNCEGVSATLRDFASAEFEFVQWWRIRKWRNDNLYSVTRWNTAIKTPDDLFNVHPRKQGVSRVRITSRISLVQLKKLLLTLVLESGI